MCLVCFQHANSKSGGVSRGWPVLSARSAMLEEFRAGTLRFTIYVPPLHVHLERPRIHRQVFRGDGGEEPSSLPDKPVEKEKDKDKELLHTGHRA